MEVKRGGQDLRAEDQGKLEELVSMAFPGCSEETGHHLKSAAHIRPGGLPHSPPT